MRNYQLQVQINGVGTPIDTSWPARPYKGAKALYHYYTRTFPANTYWLCPVD